MTALALAIVGSLCCVLAAVFIGIAVYAVPRYRLALNGPAELARSMGLVAAGRTRNDAPFWYVGTVGERPLAITVAQNFRSNVYAPGRRTRRQSVLRIVVGCRAAGEVFVWTGLPGNRVAKAEGVDAEPLLAIAGDNGFGLTRVSGAPPELLPNPDFPGTYPALCWLDHPDTGLTDARQAAKLLDVLDKLADRLERR
ncbi:MAG: hypothetical protein Q8P41_20315 [Pseudomonadota bacterium]|nr:hypothetical protein [Pseudomonadota bacterium]